MKNNTVSYMHFEINAEDFNMSKEALAIILPLFFNGLKRVTPELRSREDYKDKLVKEIPGEESESVIRGNFILIEREIGYYSRVIEAINMDTTESYTYIEGDREGGIRISENKFKSYINQPLNDMKIPTLYFPHDILIRALLKYIQMGTSALQSKNGELVVANSMELAKKYLPGVTVEYDEDKAILALIIVLYEEYRGNREDVVTEDDLFGGMNFIAYARTESETYYLVSRHIKLR